MAVRFFGTEAGENGSISTTQPYVFATLRKSSLPSADVPSLSAFQRANEVSLESAGVAVAHSSRPVPATP
jgi:hypothetical protein